MDLSQPYKVDQRSVGGLNILIYGYEGVGKTALAATAQDVPQMRDILFLNIEGGLKTIADRGDIAALDIRSSKDVENVFWALQSGSDGFGRFKTVVIDSITELQTIDLEERAKARKDGKVTLDMYGDSTAYLKKMFRWYRDLPHNVILTALPKRLFSENTETSEPIEVMPSLTDKLAVSVMGYMDCVWYMYIRELKGGDIQRNILTQKRGPYRAKTRGINFAERLGGNIENPNMKNIYDIFIGVKND